MFLESRFLAKGPLDVDRALKSILVCATGARSYPRVHSCTCIVHAATASKQFFKKKNPFAHREKSGAHRTRARRVAASFVLVRHEIIALDAHGQQ